MPEERFYVNSVASTGVIVANVMLKITAWLIVFTLFAHWGLGIRHQVVYWDRYLQRMLPFTRQR